MARLRDAHAVFRSVGPFSFCRRVWAEFTKDNLFTWAAALAYSWLFAIFPFFIFLIALIPHLPARFTGGAMAQIHGLLRELPPEMSDVLWDNIRHFAETVLTQKTDPLILIGLLVALWSASGGISNTMSALDRCYELEKGRPFWKHRLIALGLTIVVAVILLLVVVLLPLATIAEGWIIRNGHLSRFAPWLLAFDSARWIASVILMFAVLSLVYHFGPSIQHHFGWVTPGAVFVVVVWIALGMGFRFYIIHMGGKSYARTYGTVGGVAIMLLLFYLDALVMLLGAEINSEIDFEVLKVPRGTRDFRTPEDVTTTETSI
ncbi:MAG TPA: YihY/virulence factor BrkB family protein [Tepidisphaeraceae bacterium]|nr:YihY/virulence factor BrkB family protein [Tepidisphaeraceae bacterium]